MRESKYILDEKRRPVPEPNVLKWANWYESSLKDRVVARTQIGDVMVSTVFLCLDHNLSESGSPILWETMVFNAQMKDMAQDRCSGSVEQAEAMHAEMVGKVRLSQLPKTNLG